MTWVWLYAHTKLSVRAEDDGDFGLVMATQHHIKRSSVRTLSIMWELASHVEELRR